MAASNAVRKDSLRMTTPQSGRANYHKGGSQFYKELLALLDKLENAGRHVTYREAVVQGMELQDSFTGRLKHGTYVPTLDRLVKLSEYLGVPPTYFSDYIVRFARQECEDPIVLEIFRTMADLPPKSRDLVKRAILDYTKGVIGRLKSKGKAK